MAATMNALVYGMQTGIGISYGAHKRKNVNRKVKALHPLRCAPMRNAGFLMPPSTMICPGCGHFFEPEQKELAVGELIEITEKFNELRGRLISSLSPEELSNLCPAEK
jgi:hypothetical protein